MNEELKTILMNLPEGIILIDEEKLETEKSKPNSIQPEGVIGMQQNNGIINSGSLD